MNGWVQVLAVGLAGFVGSLLRWGVGSLFGRLFPTVHFPLGTFVINITGSFFLGWFLTVTGSRSPIDPTLRLAIATGFVGAYTTFSTFMYETAVLNQKGAGWLATLNLLGSLLVGILAVQLGIALGRRP